MYTLIKLLFVLQLTELSQGDSGSLLFVRNFNNVSLWRDPDYGVPIILGTESSDPSFNSSVWMAVGYAQAQDRLWQIFLGLLTANGRLSEFLGPSQLEADQVVLSLSYSGEELLDMFNSLHYETREQYFGLIDGIVTHVQEVNLGLAILPYEFSFNDIPVIPEDVFSLESVLGLALFTMRRLCAGCDPSYQLRNVEVLEFLRNRNATVAFNDLATRLGLFPLDNVVSANASGPSPTHESSNNLPSFTPSQVNMAVRALELFNGVEKSLQKLGISADGSWAIVDGSNVQDSNGFSFAEFGPQDLNPFPATYYEIFIDAGPIQANYFTDPPGMPLGQIYGVFGKVAAGRNRGYRHSNDYIYVPLNETYLFRTVQIKVKNQNKVSYPVYRALNFNGFVTFLNKSANEALVVRAPFMFEEMTGLNMLAAIFHGYSFEEFAQNLLVDPNMQSNVIHSHLLYTSYNSRGCGLNGKVSELPTSVDRRFPTPFTSVDQLPQYTIEMPLFEENLAPRYYSWNSPWNRETDWVSARQYGGEWRQAWIAQFFEQYPQPTLEQMLTSPSWMAKSNALQLGGSGLYDKFPRHLRSAFFNALPDVEPYISVKTLLIDYDGTAFVNVTGNDLDDEFVLANCWVFRVINETFSLVLPSTAPYFGVPLIRATAKVPLPRNGPNQRLESILVLLANNTQSQLLHYDWLQGRSFNEIVKQALDDLLVILPLNSRPWGVGARPNTGMYAIGDTFSAPVASLPDGQLPSLNGLCMLTSCGAVSVYSSIPFGASGLILSNGTGSPIFAPHTQDQWPLYSTYNQKPAFRLFNSTQLCLDQNSDNSVPLNPLWWAVPSGAAVLVLIAVFFSQHHRCRGYHPILDEPERR